MTDKMFEKKMKDCHKAKEKYLSLLYEIEEEYKDRYGVFPADISDDYFIDTFQSPGGESISIEDLEKSPSLLRHIKTYVP